MSAGDRSQDFGDHLCTRFGAEVALAVHPHAGSVSFHVAGSEHEHGVNLHLLGRGDLGLDMIAAAVELCADFMGA